MLTRRGFLTGLGLGGVVAATPPVVRAFLDVGKATREGEARFKRYPGMINYFDKDSPKDEWWKVDAAHREGLRVSYRDTYIDRNTGDIWTVNPETNIATKTAAGTTHAHLTSSLMKAAA